MFYMVFKGFFNMKGIFCYKNKWEDLSKDSLKKIESLFFLHLFFFFFFEKRKAKSCVKRNNPKTFFF